MPEVSQQQAPQQATTTPAVTTPAPSATPEQDTLGNAALQQQIAAGSVGQLTYEAALGRTLGAPLYKAISENLGDAKITAAAHSAVSSATAKLGTYLAGQVTASEQDAAAYFVAALDTEMKKVATLLVEDSGLMDAIRGYADANPLMVAGAAVAGAVTYVLTNQDLPLFKKSFGMGGGHSLIAGIDPGRTLNLALEQVRVGYSYEGGGTKAMLTADSYTKDGGWGVGGRFEQTLGQGEQISVSGSHIERPGENRSRLDLGYETPKLSAGAYFERARGEKTVDTLGGRVSTKGEKGDLMAHARGEMRSDGSYEAAGGLSRQLDQWGWQVEGYAGKDAAGREDKGVRAGLKWTF